MRRRKNLASLIIGDAVKDREGQRYVRKPGQDPVYVVALDDSPLTTQFNAWIEDDLLQLSSIDIENVEIKSYNASLGLGGVALSRNYTAQLSMDGSQWSLDELLDFDKNRPTADPKSVELAEGEKLNTSRLNDLKNALDDLKIADVVRKPKGMSENLRADKELVSDNEAVASLAQRGFIPAGGKDGEVEILSANGELSVGLKNGVQYVLRFGNVSGLTEEGDEETEEGEEDEPQDGLNRYLLVTTVVDESKFPPPDLQKVPKTLEDLEKMLAPGEEPEDQEEPENQEEPEDQEEPEETPVKNSEDTKPPTEPDKADADEDIETDASEPEKMKPDDDETDAGSENDAADDQPSSEPEDQADEKSADKSNADADDSQPADADEQISEDAGEAEVSGSGQATVVGGAQQDDEKASDNVESRDQPAEGDDGSESPGEPTPENEDDSPNDPKSNQETQPTGRFGATRSGRR